MASTGDKTLTDAFSMSQTCSKCYADVKDIMLNAGCSHVFCNKCDVKFKTSFPDKDCEVCFVQEHSPDLIPSSNDDKYLIASRITKLQLESGTCGSCSKEVDTVAFCEDCKTTVCQNCILQHELMTVLRNHKFIPLAEPSPPHPMVRCRIHSNEFVIKQCATCNYLHVCDECISGQVHSGHRIEPLRKRFSRRSSNKSPKPSTSTVIPMRHNTGIKDIANHYGAFRNELTSQRDNLISSIQKAECDIHSRTHSSISGMITKSENLKKDIDDRLAADTNNINKRRDQLLGRLMRRQHHIENQFDSVIVDFNKTQLKVDRLLSETRYSSDQDGYTVMRGQVALSDNCKIFSECLASLKLRASELTFVFTPSKMVYDIGTVDRLVKWSCVSQSHVKRLANEEEYIATAMVVANHNKILYTSCKGSTKTAVDLIDLNGIAIHVRKLQDDEQQLKQQSPAFAALIDEHNTLIAWELSVFLTRIDTEDEVKYFDITEYMVSDARVRCVSVDLEHKQIAIGNNKNSIINVFSFNMKFLHTITLKEDGSPPTSIVLQDNYILIADGVKNAYASNPNGDTTVHFTPPAHDPTSAETKPLCVALHKNMVYVLWITSQTDEPLRSTVVHGYTLNGHKVSSVKVRDDATFLAIMTGRDGGIMLTIGTTSGQMSVYCAQEF